MQAHTYQFVQWKHSFVILCVWKASSAFIYDIHKVPIPVFTQRLGTEALSGSQGTGLFLSLDLCSFKADPGALGQAGGWEDLTYV